MYAYIDALKRSALCDGLHADELDEVARRVKVRMCESGEIVMRQGELNKHAYIVASGRLKTTRTAPDGKETLIGYLYPGNHFGEISVLENEPAMATITTLSEGELLEFSEDGLHELLESIPRVAKNIIRILGSRLKLAYGLDRREPVRRVVGVVHSSPRGRALLDLLIGRLEAAGERITLFSNLSPPQEQPRRVQAYNERREGDVEAIGARLQGAVRSSTRVFLEMPLGKLPPNFVTWLLACDEIFWVVEPELEEESREWLKRLRTEAPIVASAVHVVWVLNEQLLAAPVWHADWNTKFRNFKVQLATDPRHPTRGQRHGLDRLTRYVRGMRMGIALGGGGARGMAHLGVLRAMERADITFDWISGTSSGAMVGVGYACGYEPQFGIDRFAEDLTPPRFFQWLPRGENWYLLSKFRTGAWERMLRPYFHDWTLEQLPIPCATVTVDLVSGTEVIRETGDATNAVLESINVPVLAQPVCRDGMALVDGGVLNNLPANVLYKKGVDLVVGVDVTTRLRSEFSGNKPGTPTDEMHNPGFIETLLRVFETQIRNVHSFYSQSIDVLIEPDTSAFGFAEFSRVPELAEIGDRAAERTIPSLRERLAEIDRQISAETP